MGVSGMRAEELRIGNFIELYKNPDGSPFISRISGFTNTGKVWFVAQPISPDCAWPIMSLTPIPLTEEWLLKLGFQDANDEKFNEYADAKMFCKGIVQIGIRSNSNYILKTPTYIYGYPVEATQFVHELQNLYFILMREELETK